MRKLLWIACIGFLTIALQAQTSATNSRKYSKKVRKTEKKLLKVARNASGTEQETEAATPDLFWVQEFVATMDPALLRPTPEALLPILAKLNQRQEYNYSAMPGTNVTPWVERGPNNVGGRTRALAWDPIDPTGKKVWAGGVTGGLWYNNDITSASSSWKHVSGLWSNLAISAIAFDPNNPGTMYVGTGEGYGTTSSTSRGFGIWKSTDSGKTFSQLSATTSYFYVNDIIVRNESGSSVVYAAVDANYFGGQWNGLTTYGLFRSTNGGTSWTNVIGNAPNSQKYAIADLEIAADNSIWAGTRNNPYSGTDKGGGRVLQSTNGTTWNVKYTLPSKPGRVELACAPGSSWLVYAAFEFGGKADTILVTHNKGTTWAKLNKPVDADLGISNSDFTRNQAWYDLILQVDPNDTNTVVIGGIDLFRSTNGGSNWTQISKWSNNNNLAGLNCSYVHADQHEFLFKSGSSSTCIVGNDGGVFYTANLASAGSSAVFGERTKDYITSQFYWGDITASSGSNIMIAGAQDNGTVKFTTAGVNATTTITSGDGAACFISPSSPNKHVASYVFNNYYYTTNNWSSSAALIADGSTGKFINPADWDDNGPGLFTGKSQGNLYRIKLVSGPGTLETISWSATGAPSCVNTFKLSNGKTRLFCGTDAGKIYVTDDAWASTPSFADANSSGSINAGNISDVDNLRSGDTIAVVLSNYGVNNIYITTNNGSSWTAKDGNLPNQPVWSIILNPNKIGEAVIATETGVYGTSDIFATSPTWSAYTEGMGAVKVATLRYRASDKMLMAVTHGRGVFTSDAWAKSNPITRFGANSTNVCTNENVNFKDSTLNDPTQWTWSFSPKTVIYLNGTDSSSQNPVVRFTEGGNYSVTLLTANSLASQSLTKTNYIKVTDTIAGKANLFANRDSICNGDTLGLYFTNETALNGTYTSIVWKRNTTTIAGTGSSNVVTASIGDQYSVNLTSNAFCVSPKSFVTNIVKPAILPLVNASAKITAPSACSGKKLTVQVTGTNTGATPVWQWFVDGVLQLSTTNTLTIDTPSAGSKVWANVFVPGRCILPANTISSDTHTVVVNATPIAPIVSRNYDTMFASNVGAGTYTWFRNGTVVGTGRVYQATQNGNFRCVYSENGCYSDSSSLIVFNSLSAGTTLLKGIEIWPVPAAEKIFVSSVETVKNLRIFNMAGQEISKEWYVASSANNFQTMEILISKFPPGNYILELNTASGIKQLPFVRE